MISLCCDVADPTALFVRYDNRPTILPDWPRSTRMGLVMVVETPDGLQAYAILTRNDLRVHTHPLAVGRRLFFLVPRSLICELNPEKLTPDQFED